MTTVSATPPAPGNFHRFLVRETMEGPMTLRQRRPHSKSSGGCGTCKARRVKCDETKPICERCRRAQRVCSGYIVQPTSRLRVQRKQYHKGFRFINTSFGPEQILSPHSLISADNDSTLLSFFVTAIVPGLQSRFRDGFLDEIDSHVMSRNQVLRHASVALCLQHILWSQLQQVEPLYNTSELRLRCTQAYTRSLCSFQAALSGSKPESILTAKASMLLSTLEAMRGNTSGAQAHLMGAIGIIQDSNSNASTTAARKPSIKLARSCIAKGLNFCLHSVDMALFEIIKDFTTEQAGLWKEQEIEPFGLNFLIDTMGIKTFTFIAALDMGTELGMSPADAQKSLLGKLLGVKQALNTVKPSVVAKDLPMWHILYARILICEIHAKSGIARQQVSYDLYQDNFVTVLDKMQECLDSMPSSTEGEVGARGICPEIGFIPTLSTVAKLCRHPSIRRRALDLLKLGPSQEGLWNAAETIQVCQALMDFEEREPDGSIRLYVPEEHRIVHMSLRKQHSDSDDSVRKWIEIWWKPQPGVQEWTTGHIDLSGDDLHAHRLSTHTPSTAI